MHYAFCDQARAGLLVELGDVVAAAREQQHVPTVGCGGLPVVEHRADRGGAVVVDVQSVVLAVGGSSSGTRNFGQSVWRRDDIGL